MAEGSQVTENLEPPQTGIPRWERDIRNLATLCHLSGLLGLVVPFGNVIGPLVIWLLKKDDHPFVEEHGREALNFQISMSIYLAVSVISMVLTPVGIVPFIGLAVADLILIIMASSAASRGESCRYPITIRFLK